MLGTQRTDAEETQNKCEFLFTSSVGGNFQWELSFSESPPWSSVHSHCTGTTAGPHGLRCWSQVPLEHEQSL